MGLVLDIFAASFVAIGSFLLGYDSGIIASGITMQHFKDYFNNPRSSMIGAVVATFTGTHTMVCFDAWADEAYRPGMQEDVFSEPQWLGGGTIGLDGSAQSSIGTKYECSAIRLSVNAQFFVHSLAQVK